MTHTAMNQISVCDDLTDSAAVHPNKSICTAIYFKESHFAAFSREKTLKIYGKLFTQTLQRLTSEGGGILCS